MPDPQTLPQSQIVTPAGNALGITPSDTLDLADYTREIYVGVGGDLALVMALNGEVVILKDVPQGSRLPYVVTRVNVQGTTATDIVGFW